MDMSERQNKIVELVRQQKKVKATTLSRLFDVSVETIRKDLIDLHEQGRILKVHGGATIPRSTPESAYERRRSKNQSAKNAMAKAAVEQIKDNSTIFLDYGTTTMALAEALINRGLHLTVVTNSIPIVSTLAQDPNISVLVPGGSLRNNEQALVGPITEATLSNINMDKGFFSCVGIHPDTGMTNPNLFEVAASQTAIRHCGSVVFMIDDTKFNSVAVHKVAGFEDLDLLIVNGELDQELQHQLDQADVEVLVIESN